MDSNRKRILKDLKDFSQTSLNITLVSDDLEDISNIQVAVGGPDESPYEGGTYILEISIPNNFPYEAPSIYFKTPIWHPNVSKTGRVCVDTLDSNWHAGITLLACAEVAQTLLIQPNPLSPLNGDAAAMFSRDRDLFDKNAALWNKHLAGGSPQAPSDLEEKLDILLALGARKKRALQVAAECMWDIESASMRFND